MADEEMAAHYALGNERARLFADGEPRLELVRTLDLLDRVLPPPPATVLDVGGGPGTYAAALAGRGYTVRLYDVVDLHVTQAAELGTFAAAYGDARDLPEDDAVADAVLLLGPLYHLTDPADRTAALAEARRVVRPGGVVAAVAITRFAALFDGLNNGWLGDPQFLAIAERDVADGQHRNPDGNPEWFTTAYFHHPDELAAEMRAAGFADVTLYSVEGPGSWLQREHWHDPERRAQLLYAARLVESEPSLLGVGAHLMAVGRSP